MLPEEISTARLALRPMALRDAEAIFNYSNDPDWARYELNPTPYTRRHAEEFVAKCVLRDRGRSPIWAVTHGGEMIGTIVLGSENDWRIAVLGYGLERRHWGQGLAGEATRAVLQRAFEAYPQLGRVRAHTDPRNDRSIGLLEKLGFVREGVLRSNQLKDGAYVDEAIYGLLRDEWRAPA